MTKEQKRLRINGIIVAVTGILLAAAVLTPVYPLGRLFLTLAHWPFFEAPATLDSSGRLMLAIGGGLTAGVGAMMWTVGTEVMPVAPAAGRRRYFVPDPPICLAWHRHLGGRARPGIQQNDCVLSACISGCSDVA